MTYQAIRPYAEQLLLIGQPPHPCTAWAITTDSYACTQLGDTGHNHCHAERALRGVTTYLQSTGLPAALSTCSSQREFCDIF